MKKSIRIATVTVIAGITLAASTGLATAQPAAHGVKAAHGVTAAQVHSASTIHLPATDVKHGRTQVGPATSGRHRSSANSTSGNWSGYAAYGTTFTGVYGRWIVPAVNCGFLGTGASSTWIGLDGYGNGTVEQLGTRQNCLWGGASYYPWYEVYPQSEVALPSAYTVAPGDVMWAETIHTSGNNYYFAMGDQSRSWSWGQTVVAPGAAPQNATAEWITEQPSCFYECNWLANFGTQSFLTAEALRSGGSWGPINAYWNDAITMQSGSTVKAVPSGLTNGPYSSSFSDRFLHS